MKFAGRDIINIGNLVRDDFEHIFEIADTMENFPQNYIPDALYGKIVACLFFEPSTRTSNSFQSAALRLSAQVLVPDLIGGSSLKKGESFEDTIRMFDSYSDVIVVRHPKRYSAKKAAEIARKPVINAGDGTNQHPTQTLLDLYTIDKERGKIDDVSIAMVGDLKYGRTVHSLATALTRFLPDYVAFVSPPELKMPTHYIQRLKKVGVEVVEFFQEIEDLPPNIDIIYMTRVQQERFKDSEEYQKYAGVYQLNLETLSHFNDNVRIMHPLPRIEGHNTEILPEVDDTPQAIYFKQAANGVPVREALLALVTGAVK